jgi:glycerate kinase
MKAALNHGAMRILVAPDKFKGSLGAGEVGTAIAAGLRAALPTAEIEVVALADGGEGTSEAICRARHGTWIDCPAHDALGREVTARYAWLNEARLAAMEMSAAAGLWRLTADERDPLRATTFGVGEMLGDAVGRGATEIIIGIGGSATNDGGFGMARALGFQFLNRVGAKIGETVPALLELDRIESPHELQLPVITAASDVTNPLLGPEGATRTFGPQKGATSEQLELLESSLAHLAKIATQSLGCDFHRTPGAGAAGGLGFGLLTFCKAAIRSGFAVVAEAIDLTEKIAWSQVVITGEGKLDQQTLAGKGPAGLAQTARAAGKRVFAIVGQAAHDSKVRALFDEVITLDDMSPGYRETPCLLEKKAQALAESWK